MTHDEMIAVITAQKEGKPLECKGENYGGWVDCYHDSLNFLDWIYRVKPEPPKPREWTVRDEGGNLRVIGGVPVCADCIRVREVLE